MEQNCPRERRGSFILFLRPLLGVDSKHKIQILSFELFSVIYKEGFVLPIKLYYVILSLLPFPRNDKINRGPVCLGLSCMSAWVLGVLGPVFMIAWTLNKRQQPDLSLSLKMVTGLDRGVFWRLFVCSNDSMLRLGIVIHNCNPSFRQAGMAQS